MELLKPFVTLSIALCIPSTVLGQGPRPPCSTIEHRAFDFWIGEWDVRDADGVLVGTNSVTKTTGGCILHEQYETSRGYSGQSFNTYDVSRGIWHQTWVDSSGLLLILEGGIQGGKMILEGKTTGSDQQITRQRISWTPNPDGTVRQVWESLGPSGKWEVLFDGEYSRK